MILWKGTGRFATASPFAFVLGACVGACSLHPLFRGCPLHSLFRACSGTCSFTSTLSSLPSWQLLFCIRSFEPTLDLHSLESALCASPLQRSVQAGFSNLSFAAGSGPSQCVLFYHVGLYRMGFSPGLCHSEFYRSFSSRLLAGSLPPGALPLGALFDRGKKQRERTQQTNA